MDANLYSVPARRVAAVGGRVALDGVVAWYDAAMAELDAAYPPADAAGADTTLTVRDEQYGLPQPVARVNLILVESPVAHDSLAASGASAAP